MWITDTNESLLAAMFSVTKLFSQNHLSYVRCVGTLLKMHSQHSLPPCWKLYLWKKEEQMGQHCSSAHITALFDTSNHNSTQEMHIHASLWLQASPSDFSLYRAENMWHRRHAILGTHDHTHVMSQSTNTHVERFLDKSNTLDLIQNKRISISIKILSVLAWEQPGLHYMAAYDISKLSELQSWAFCVNKMCLRHLIDGLTNFVTLHNIYISLWVFFPDN